MVNKIGGNRVMLEGWVNSVKAMGVFIICAQMLIQFKPKGVYEKYIRYLVSIMLLVQLMNPIGSMLGIFGEDEVQNNIRDIEQDFFRWKEKSYEMEAEAENIWSVLLEEFYTQQTEESEAHKTRESEMMVQE